MKTLLKSTAILAALFVTVSATAADQNTVITQCKSLISAEFNDVKRVKLAGVKDRRGAITAKFRVSADGQNARYECKSQDEAQPLLVRLDKAVQQVAGGE